ERKRRSAPACPAGLSREGCKAIFGPFQQKSCGRGQRSTLFKCEAPARRAGRALIKGFSTRAGWRQMPAQMRGAGLPFQAIAQQEERDATFRCPEAETPAGGEIKHLGRSANIGDDARNGPASE